MSDPTHDSRQLRLRIPAWGDVRRVRESIALLMAGLPEELCAAAQMTASELLENALKYGGPAEAALDMEVSPEAIRIEVTHPPVAESSTLGRRIQEIASGDAQALFLSRLQEMAEGSSDSGGLGLYRIAYEGRFHLSYTPQPASVTVTATRSLS
jgi:hypothetical protein